MFESGVASFGLGTCGPDGRRGHLLCCCKHLLRAKGERVDLADFVALRLLIPVIKSGVNAAQHGLEWDTGVLPDLDERPIESGEQVDHALALRKALLDLGEVVCVVEQESISTRATKE